MEKLLVEAMNCLNVGVHIIDSTGKTIVYNEKMSALEAMKSGDVLHKNIQDVFQFQENEESTLLSALHSGEAILNVKQQYFNNVGRKIMTVNNTYPIVEDGAVTAVIEVATDVTKMERLLRHQKEALQSTFQFDDIIGANTALEDVIELAKRAARTASNVLVIGETGTGKELFVQSIHDASNRSAKPLIAQNCAALPDSLMESILFGTAKGAFTDAEDRPGLFELAKGGTLLLDEVNSLPLQLQAKLLRVLQDKKVRRIGGLQEVAVDVRVIATINEDPFELIINEKLRKDLYYRLAVVALMIPPLRERMDDLDKLVDTFIQKYNELLQMNVQAISPAVRAHFNQHDWPGNVRELEHAIESAMNSMEYEQIIDEVHLPYYFRMKTSKMQKIPLAQLANDASKTLKEQLLDAERVILEKVLSDTQHHITLAAKQLGLSRQSLQYRMKRLGLN
ncbi:sigma-54 interaction domain-containing protein [Kurthia huakuii]|uniref:sigma-54 interaction domain-containing protein n=1 Tax=Kurthia huakuii TaxID=1421019 RepID=UPI000494E29D|nr:sigma 54-interacting transcriptional regulator [Kurthia huakuii]MBM7700462.1 arginine utilization regulatory protein [Kurthia huakuii]